ncbi:MAG: alpha/beta fold hydrolase, partial [Gammaproteobacteria bacterium]
TGAEDFSSPPGDVTALAARLPDARLVVYPECSHFCLSTREDETVACITDFMRAVGLSNESGTDTPTDTPTKEHSQCLL